VVSDQWSVCSSQTKRRWLAQLADNWKL